MKNSWLIVLHASDFGGAENEAIQLGEALEAAGKKVHFCTRYRLDKGSSIRDYAQKKSWPLSSPIEFFWKGVYGKIVFFLAWIRHFVQFRSWPSFRSQSRFGEHASKLFRDHFWHQKRGEKFLKKHQGVVFFGEPLDWFASLYQQAHALGVYSIYRPSREIKASDRDEPRYQMFLSGLNHLTSMWVLGQQAVERVNTYYGYSRVQSLILPPLHWDLKGWKKKESKGSLKFGLVSRLVPGKAVHVGIQALSFGQGSLEIAGDGPALSELIEESKQLNVEDRIVFHGSLGNEAMPAFYATLDALIISSESEGAPICGIEALYLGIPVLSTRVGVMPELLGQDYPGFFDQGDAKALSEKMNPKTLAACQSWPALKTIQQKLSLDGITNSMKQWMDEFEG